MIDDSGSELRPNIRGQLVVLLLIVFGAASLGAVVLFTIRPINLASFSTKGFSVKLIVALTLDVVELSYLTIAAFVPELFRAHLMAGLTILICMFCTTAAVMVIDDNIVFYCGMTTVIFFGILWIAFSSDSKAVVAPYLHPFLLLGRDTRNKDVSKGRRPSVDLEMVEVSDLNPVEHKAEARIEEKEQGAPITMPSEKPNVRSATSRVISPVRA